MFKIKGLQHLNSYDSPPKESSRIKENQVNLI